MSQRIVIKVAPDGSTEVRTEGFTGNSCKQASQFLERALGSRQSEQLTQDFYKVSLEADHNHLQQGEGRLAWQVKSGNWCEPASQGYGLRHSFSAMRVSFTWLGTRKSLTSDQRQQAASQFGAEQKFISAGKKLIDTSHPAMLAVNQMRRQITEYWKGCSLPFPEPGIRLVRHTELEQLNGQMDLFQQQLGVAVSHLQNAYDEIEDQARERLGSLYCESDYPASFLGLFEVSWDFPNVEPPDYLRRLQPEIYQQECSRIRTQFEEAVQLAEQSFVEEPSALVSHLSERLSGTDDGKPKVFRDSAIENLTEFFERFRRLNVSSSGELDELVQRAHDVVGGVHPHTLRIDRSVRQQVATQLSGVQSVLDGPMAWRCVRELFLCGRQEAGARGRSDANLWFG